MTQRDETRYKKKES